MIQVLARAWRVVEFATYQALNQCNPAARRLGLVGCFTVCGAMRKTQAAFNATVSVFQDLDRIHDEYELKAK
jgi:hypothetical protein